jgi:hypothetical protein
LAPRVQSALEHLGYDLDEFDTEEVDPPIWLIDDDRLGEFRDALEGRRPARDSARLLVISASPDDDALDSRVIGRVSRPGRLGAIYSILQRVLEETPRKDPRIDTQLTARSIRADRRSIGAVVSLSEGGCRLQTDEPLRKGAELEIQFGLPDFGLISTTAECRYVRSGSVGLAFSKPSWETQCAISHFVTAKLARPGPTQDASARGLG